MITGVGYKSDGEFLSQEGKVLKAFPRREKLLEIGISCNNAGIKVTSNGFLKAFKNRKEL